MHPPRSLVAAVGAVLCALVLAPLAPASAQGSGPRGTGPSGAAGTARPDVSHLHHSAGTGVRLARSFHGAKAVRKLGDDLTTAARVNHRSPAQLRHLLTTDPTMWLTTDGQLYVKDERPQQDASGTSFVGSPPRGAVPAAPQPLDQTFGLHSLKGAPYTLYLDFDGQDLTGTRWKTQNGVTADNAAGWDPAGDGVSTFSDGERTEIQFIWSVVAEDYAPFDIDVTTEDPGADALTRTSATDAAYGTRVVFTDSKSVWDDTCQDNCGGIAFVGAFGQVGSTDPAFVFSLGEYDDPWFMAAAASHESGHTFGLTHDGDLPDTAQVSYDSGHGLWGPIMGAPYYRDVVQWSDGRYANANNQQDDVAILRQDGLAERADEAGDTAGTAGAVPAGTAYIGNRHDVDLYALGACTGTVSAQVAPSTLSPDLDVDLAIVDGAGQVVARDDAAAADRTHWYVDPADGVVSYFTGASGLDAQLATPLDGGPYYLRVDGGGGEAGGAGDPVADYDDYGSMGAYQVTVSGCTQPATAPSAPAYAHGSMTGTSATVTWSAPASDGGSTITGYDVEVDGVSAASLDADARSYTATGLSAAAHTVTVRARNGVAESPAATVQVRPLTVPGTPTGLAVAYSGTSATLSWVAPADDGGSPITSYRVSIGSFTATVYAGSSSITVSGFVPGLSYPVSVAATNSTGTGGAATTTVRVPVAPTAPTQLGASADPNGAVTATWHAPSDDGGSAITGYQVRLDDGSWTPVSETTYVFTDAASGAHTVEVAAINAAGTGPAATASAVVPVVPGAPTGLAVTVDALGRSVTATWKAPASDGGSAVADYQVQIDGGDWHATGGTRSYTSGTLAAGDHTVAVRAVNGVGTGASATATATMPAPPEVPGLVSSFATSIDAAQGQVQLVWGPPSSDGGAPVTGYDVTVDGTVHHLGAGATSYTLDDITLGHHYTVSVNADNAVGSGATQGADVVGFLPPGQVGSVSTTASATDRTLTVAWAAPTSTGGSSSVSYRIRLGAGLWQDVTARTYTFTAVAAGPRQVEIQAVGDGGAGDSLIVPVTMPSVPTAPSAPGDLAATIDPATGTGTVHWTAPLSDGGDPITGYEVTIDGATTAVTGTSAALSGLTLGRPVQVSVKAENAVGASTVASISVTWLQPPSAVSDLAVAGDAGALTATVTWAAPATTGGSPITGYDVSFDGTVTHVDATARIWTATGLALGRSYPVSVVAVSAGGVGPAAGTSVRLIRTASAPTLGTPTVDPVGDTVTLSWGAPASDGGAAVTGYEIALDGGPWTSVAGLTTTLHAVADGSHTLAVAADNAAGRGTTASVGATMPHRAVPTAVRELTISPDLTAGAATVTWARPVENDTTGPSVLPVTGYLVTVGDAAPRSVTGGTYQITGLHLGDTVSVTVAAVNVLGTGAAAGATAALVRAPDPVTGLVATVDATTRTSVHVSWTAPASDGGSTITGYRVIATGYAGAVGVVASDSVVTGTSTTLTGLTLGTAYQITVAAVTAVGTSGANLATVVPTDEPGAVRYLTSSVNERTGVATVSWSAPASLGGTPITGYTVTVNGVASTLASYAYSYQLHLSPATTYAVSVAATNAAGTGAASALSIHPAPGPVAALSVDPDREAGSLAVSWTAPAAVDGATITGYQVTLGDATWVTVSGTSYTFNAVAPGYYAVAVRAVTADRTGPSSTVSTPAHLLAPSTVPGAIGGIGGSFDGVAGTAALMFLAPADGGSPITGYETSLDGGAWTAATVVPIEGELSITLTDVAPGPHTFAVRAVNAKGAGAAGQLSETMPAPAPPTAPGAPYPAQVTADATTGTTAHVTWTAPTTNGGASITGYSVSVSPATGVSGCSAVTGALTLACDLSGLTLGTTYTVTVAAVNSAGTGPAATGSVTPVIRPGPVTGLTATADADAGTVTATWDALGYPGNGGAAITDYQVSIDGGTAFTANGASLTTHTFTGIHEGEHTVTIYAERGDTASADLTTADVTMPVKEVVPGAVTVLSAAVSDDASSTRITWGAPVSDGNAAITGYRIAVDGTVVVTSQTAQSYVVTGSPIGTAVTVTVTALNVKGPGAEAGVTFTPRRVPGAVTLTAQTPVVDGETRVGSATVTWPVPVDDGGVSILGYDVSLDGGAVSRQTATEYALTGLALGATHTVTVAAVNALGDGPSRSVTVAAPVTSPTSVGGVQAQQAPAAPGSVLLTWTVPSDNGGSTIAAYDVDDGTTTHRVAAPGQSLTLDGLILGTGYTFTVTAVNAAGLSGTAGPTGTVRYTPAWTPDAPSGLQASTARNAGTLTASWSSMTSSGGLPVTGYRVELDGGGWIDVTESSHTFAEVLPGLHEFAVEAVNARGPGPAAYRTQVSMAAPQTVPAGVYGLRANVDARALTAMLTWSTPPTDGDSPITGYQVSVDGTTTVVAPDPSTASVSTTIDALTLGQEYDVSVAAVNAIGVGPAQSVTVRPVLAPSAAVVTASYDPRTVTGEVHWTAPANTGGELTGYDLWVNSDLHHLRADQTSYDLGSVQPGGEYDVVVIPRNSAGAGPSAGAVIDPFAIPSAPQNVTASVQEIYAGYASLTVNWTAPADDGGAPDLGYLVYVDGELYTYPGTTFPMIISSGWLPYSLSGDYHAGQTVTVTAYNAFLESYDGLGEGPGAETVASAVVPPSPPGAPASVCVDSVDVAAGTATVHWTPPTDTGSGTFVGYHLGVTGMVDASYSVTRDLGADVDSYALSGLHDGESYEISVSAQNDAYGVGMPTNDYLYVDSSAGDCPTDPGDPGTGDPGAGDPGTGDPGGDTPSATVPGAVVALSASTDAASRTIGVSWMPPLDDGGSAITGYVVALDGSESEVGPGVLGTSFSGVAPGDHMVTVWAENAVGRSVEAGTPVTLAAPPSRPAPPVTKPSHPAPSYTVPGAPRIGKAKPGKKRGKTTVVISWKAPAATGGRPVTGYEVVVYKVKKHKAKASKRVTAAAAAHSVEVKLKRKKGTTYAFAVLAHNALGWSAASGRSKAVQPR